MKTGLRIPAKTQQKRELGRVVCGEQNEEKKIKWRVDHRREWTREYWVNITPSCHVHQSVIT